MTSRLMRSRSSHSFRHNNRVVKADEVEDFTKWQASEFKILWLLFPWALYIASLSGRGPIDAAYCSEHPIT